MTDEKTFKCRICGGEVTWEKGASIGECLYCSSKQPIPTNLTAHTKELYNDAMGYLKKNEYDKAFVVYETIIKENADDAEAYWGRCLCRYGIEYVDDPGSGKKIPTCHRLQAKSILKDEDYLATLKHAPDEATKSLYTMRATTIDVIQRDIFSISQGEEGKYDIFISFKDTDENENRTKDSHLAEEIYHELIKRGYKVFFSRVTLADKLGAVYEPYIYAAIHSAKVMIVVGTKPEYIDSAWVRNEWSRYLDLVREGEDKKLIVCFKDMSRKALPEEFVPFQNLDMNDRGSMPMLIQNIDRLLRVSKGGVSTGGSVTAKKAKKKFGCLLTVLVILAIIGASVFYALQKNDWEDIEYPNYNNTNNNTNTTPPAPSGELTKLWLSADKTSIAYGDTVKLSVSTTPSTPGKYNGNSFKASYIRYYVRINGVDTKLDTTGLTAEYVVNATDEVSFWAKYCPHSNHSTTDGDLVSNEVKMAVENHNGLYYQDNGNGLTIIDYTGTSDTLIIPSAINGKTVTAIQSLAFQDCTSLKTVTVPDSVTVIGGGAFAGCNSLVEMKLPFIGNRAAVTEARWGVFGYIFGDDKPNDDDMNRNTTKYYTSGSSGYTSQSYSTSNTNYMYYFAIPKSIRKVTVTNQTAIPAYAFQNCDLIKDITFASEITEIGEKAFQNCSALSSCGFTAGESTVLAQYAFQNCTSLTSFGIPSGILQISSYAFDGCTAMTALEIPNTVETIANCAFKNCVGLTKITVPDSVKTIGGGAFAGCNSLVEMTLPFVGKGANVTEARWGVFGYIFGDDDPNNDSMKQNTTKYYTSGSSGYTSQSYSTSNTNYMYYFAIPKSIRKVTVTNQTAIPAYAFQNCDLIKEIRFEKTVTAVNISAFDNAAALTDMTLSCASDTVIHSYAFADCDSFTAITIPSGVSELGEYAYSGCDRLQSAVLPTTLIKLGTGSFSGCAALGNTVLPDSLEEIGKCAFQNCISMTAVTVPDSVTVIGGGAFAGCNGLLEMTLPFIGNRAAVTEARWGVFGYIFGDDDPNNDSMKQNSAKYYTSGSSGYTSQSYSTSNTNYMYYFAIPKSLRKVTVTNQTAIPAYAFQNCDLIREITFTKAVTMIGAQALETCTALKTLTYGGSESDWTGIVFGDNWNNNAADFEIIYQQ